MIYQSIVHCQPIHKGWSGDNKYCAITSSGEKFLLRISDPTLYGRRNGEFHRMQQVAALKIPMCDPMEFGTCESGVYSIQRWIDGDDAEEIIPTLSRDEQYAYGRSSGEILARLHSLPAPADTPAWEPRFNNKIERKIQMYADCPLKYEGGDALLQYLAKNRHLLENRPQSYQHGDYHIGNMMIDRNGKLTIIDFDKDDYGDPWEEFNRIVWSAQVAPDFARGMVDGYFDGNVPLLFWRLLALYICSNTLGSLPWAIPYGEQEISVMLRQAAEVLTWYRNMETVIPSWYEKRD